MHGERLLPPRDGTLWVGSGRSFRATLRVERRSALVSGGSGRRVVRPSRRLSRLRDTCRPADCWLKPHLSPRPVASLIGQLPPWRPGPILMHQRHTPVTLLTHPFHAPILAHPRAAGVLRCEEPTQDGRRRARPGRRMLLLQRGPAARHCCCARAAPAAAPGPGPGPGGDGPAPAQRAPAALRPGCGSSRKPFKAPTSLSPPAPLPASPASALVWSGVPHQSSNMRPDLPSSRTSHSSHRTIAPALVYGAPGALLAPFSP